mmetsp:Transcript_15305/g.23049  ORF Transcript_15305/g.23049 Transcript_15305/m.23049 type:complete len:259 (+) Transcript_15305:67-843(+)
MSFINDLVMDIYYSYRLGNDAKLDECLYADIRGGEQPRIRRRDELPRKSESKTRIIVISDTHQRHDVIGDLPEGDIFIHAGDVFMSSQRVSHSRGVKNLKEFNEWLGSVRCRRRIVVSGNHDGVMQALGTKGVQEVLSNATYLENSSTNVGDLKIWGSPLSHGRSRNDAFQSGEFYEATRNEALCSTDVDILVTHGPCFQLQDTMRPALHIWGHAHGYHGIHFPGQKLFNHKLSCVSINACIMDGKYNPSNCPVVIDL